MRVACLSTSTVPSRTANSIQTMKASQALVELGHQVQVSVPGRRPRIRWEDMASQYGLHTEIPVRWIPCWRPLRRYDFCLIAVVAAWRWKADLLYVWPLQAAALSSALGMPTVLEMHDRPGGRLGPWLLERFFRGRGARKLLHTTRALRLWLEEAYGAGRVERLAVLAPNGVDLQRYRDLPRPEDARQRLGLPQALTVGYTGHLYPGRGLELMLELASRNPRVSFVWAGGEPEAARYWTRRVVEEELANVLVLGFVPNAELPMMQAACDILLMPYERKIEVSGGGDTSAFASPMKTFEYLAAGRAIMASDLPVIREVLSAENALLIPPEDTEAWDAGLRALLRDDRLRKRLAESAVREAQNYSWQARARRALEGSEGGRD